MMNQLEYDNSYAVIFVDKDFNIIYLNHRAVEEYGEVIGGKCYRVFNGYDTPCDENSPYVCPIKVLQNSDLKKFTGIYVFNTKKEQYISLTVEKEKEYFVQKQIKLSITNPEVIDVKDVLNNLYEGIIIIDKNGKIKMINEKFVSIFDIPINGDYFLEKNVEEVQKFIPDNIKTVFKRETIPEKEEFVVHYKDKYLIIKMFDVNNNYNLWSFVEKEEIDLGDEIFRILLETTPVGIFLQCSGRFMYVNPTLASILEATPGELIGTSIDEYIHLEDRSKLSTLFQQKKSSRESANRDTIRINTTSGNTKWVELTSEMITFKGRNCSIGSIIDITDRKNLEENLRKLATIDQLTDIYNRYAFEKFLEEEIYKAERYGFRFSVVMFDIDNFKNINDIYGHQMGDKVLKDIVKIVRNNIRKSDIFARWGGEEFMILVPIKDKKDAVKIAEKIRKKVEEFKFDNMGKITISLGVSFYKEGDSIKTIVRRVDTALYQAKKLGKNITVVVD